MLSDSLSIWFLVCLPVCLSLIPHPLPTFPTIAYRILIINFVYFISLSYTQVSMSQSLFIKRKRWTAKYLGEGLVIWRDKKGFEIAKNMRFSANLHNFRRGILKLWSRKATATISISYENTYLKSASEWYSVADKK